MGLLASHTAPRPKDTEDAEDDHRHRFGHTMKRSCPEAEERDGGLRRAVTEIERLLGYVFRDQSLLAEALTHSSYPDHRSYQRLEFVGDAALSLAITNHLYLTNPDLGPGRLSALRAANISTEKLARVAVRHRLYRFLRRNSHALDQMVLAPPHPCDDSDLVRSRPLTLRFFP